MLKKVASGGLVRRPFRSWHLTVKSSARGRFELHVGRGSCEPSRAASRVVVEILFIYPVSTYSRPMWRGFRPSDRSSRRGVALANVFMGMA